MNVADHISHVIAEAISLAQARDEDQTEAAEKAAVAFAAGMHAYEKFKPVDVPPKSAPVKARSSKPRQR